MLLAKDFSAIGFVHVTSVYAESGVPTKELIGQSFGMEAMNAQGVEKEMSDK